jgi:predicted permease
MRIFQSLGRRIRSFLHEEARNTELDEELRFHIARQVEENISRGMSVEDATRSAKSEFGSIQEATYECYQARGLSWLQNVLRDLLFSYRLLRKSPGFTAVALLTLAMGVGANTAVFSLINGLLLRPLPVPHADQLANLRFDRSDETSSNFSLSEPFLRALEKRHEVFQDAAGFTGATLQVHTNSGNVEVPGALVSGQFFATLQTPAQIGRYLTPGDDQPGGGQSGFGVVISEGFWRTWFNSAPDIVGRKLTIANAAFTVVGVMPGRFIGADPTQRPEIYIPLSAEPVIHAPFNLTKGGVRFNWLRVIARRNPGVSLEQANASLEAQSNSILDQAVSDAGWVKDARNHHFHFAADSGSKGFSYIRFAFKKPLVAVFCLCGAILLLSCLNLASLLMARAGARERELATRLAIGATRSRLIQQLMMESLLIAGLGTVMGLAVSPIISRSLASLLLANDHNVILDTALDVRVFLFAALVTALAAILIGVVPALRAASGNLIDQIKNSSCATPMQGSRRLVPRVLMSIQVALALILVIGAGLLTTSLAKLYQAGLGFDPKGLVNLRLAMNKQRLEGDALLRWYQTFGDELKHQPGVEDVSFEMLIPLSGDNFSAPYRTPFTSGDRLIDLNTIAPEYFRTMHIPILNGRDFQWQDTKSSGQKIILNEAAARILFPGRSAIGRYVLEGQDARYEVIAVVGDTRYTSIRERPPALAYLPITQSGEKKFSLSAVIRLSGPAASLAAAARSLSMRRAPEIPAPVMTTMSSDLDASISSERMMALLSLFFAGCALFVTAIGLYGVLEYATARRTNEIGIRMALGARRTQVLLMVFRENAWIAASGSIAGLVAALLVSHALASFMYGISVRDPWVLTSSVLALGAVASAASLIPSLRASRIEPNEAIRYE